MIQGKFISEELTSHKSKRQAARKPKSKAANEGEYVQVFRMMRDRNKGSTQRCAQFAQARPADDAATHPGRPPGSEVQPVRGRRTTASPSVLPPAEAPSGSGSLHLPAGAPSGRLGSV